MEAMMFLTGMMETVSEFIDSNIITAFLMAVGIIVMLGAVYGTKLWYDIREVKKMLDEMERSDGEGLA